MSKEGNAQQGYRQQEGDVGTPRTGIVVALVDGPHEHGEQEHDVDDESAVERHAEGVDEEQLEPSAHLHDARHDAVEHDCDEHHGTGEGEQRALHVRVRVLLVVVNEYDGGETKEVEQVHADGESRKAGYEHQPAVAVRLVCTVLPLEYQPEHDSCEQGRVGVDLSLDRTEPERVAEGVCERTDESGTHDGHQLSGGHLLHTRTDELARQVGDAPEQEHDAARTEQCRHDVDHVRHFRRVTGKLGEEVGGKHEERCTGRVTHFEFITGGDELRAVPETGSRLDGHAVDYCRNEEGEPTHQVVDTTVLSHSESLFVNLFTLSRKDRKEMTQPACLSAAFFV